MRKHTYFTKALLICLCTVLIAATVLTLTACKKENEGERDTPVTFTLKVVTLDGTETTTEITTKKWTVGEALLDKGIIEGEDGAYGLYIKSVNGITADYDVDQTYWAFYIEDEYAMTGIDTTPIEEGVIFRLVYTK